ncbi:MAG: glutathione S-transferase [Rhodospirillaceae bacterium]|nr:glutathione S-transferase [Rhodospirillaceae bacterium]|tara:strand:- start:14298 stop:14918 length:621 start_codon:yes stop_codon:yes gene_type:complete
MKIIGRKSSSNVQKVLWCCAELGVAYEREDAGREFGVVNTDAFHELNPNRRVPVLIDGDFILWESNAIVRMISAKQGFGSLYPENLQERGNAERWMDWQLSTLGPGFTGLFHGLIRDKPEDRNWDAINKSIETTQSNLEILDHYLANTPFVAGDRFTMGDIPVGIYAYRWLTLEGIDRKPLPNLERWYAALQSRTAFKEFVMTGLG